MKKTQTGVTLVEMVVCTFAVAALGVGIAVVYVVFHFAAKFW